MTAETVSPAAANVGEMNVCLSLGPAVLSKSKARQSPRRLKVESAAAMSSGGAYTHRMDTQPRPVVDT